MLRIEFAFCSVVQELMTSRLFCFRCLFNNLIQLLRVPPHLLNLAWWMMMEMMEDGVDRIV